jgi:glycosyltransferase involved in cell wall biosynthesis
MRVLIVTKIFPNRAEPWSSPFNRQQFRALSRLADVQVLATIPWFPGASAFRRWSPAGRLTAVPASDEIDGLRVRHPRFAFVPKVGHAFAGPLYAASLGPTALGYKGRVDVVLGAWAYPDGYAAVRLAELLGVPAVIKLHGSDLNVLGERAALRRQIGFALSRAARVVAVSKPLAERAVRLGASPDRVDVVPNGIDRQRFFPQDRHEARRALGLPLEPPLVLFLGHLSEAKGALDLLRAFQARPEQLAGVELALVGDGADSERCRALARSLGVNVRFPGAQPHGLVPTWLAACDVLALPSWNEGMPNVVVEALACGRPVVATRVGGIPELVRPDVGALVAPRDPEALADALQRVLRQEHDSGAISSSLERPDWDGSAKLLHASLLRALGGAAREAA